MADEEEELVGCCSECHTEISEAYMIRKGFFAAGVSTPCPHCGGVVIVMRRKDKDSALISSDLKRGIGSGDSA